MGYVERPPAKCLARYVRCLWSFEADEAARKTILARMQNLVYDEAPYHILYYDAELHAYRTDKFAGWTDQPSVGGTPLFGYGSFGYTKLTDAAAVPSPTPEASGSAAPGASAAPSPSGSGSPAGSSSDSTLPLLLGAAALIVILAVGLVVMRRRGPRVEEE